MQTTQKQARRAGLLGLALVLSVWLVATGCSPIVYTGPLVPGTQSLPVPASYAWSFGNAHHDYPAIDIPVPTGTTVTNVAAGTVIKAPVGGSCGNGVIIDGNDGVRYTYCHGSYPLVSAGQWLSAGVPIMVSGYTGTVYPAGPGGAHLHLQMALNRGSGPLVCPQGALQAFAQGQGVDTRTLPQAGCSY